MNRFFSLLLTVLISGIMPLSSALARDREPMPPLSQATLEVKSVQPLHWQLANGMQVLFLPNEELPLVSGSLFLRGGTLWESPRQMGVVSMMGAQLREGGAGTLDADALDTRLEKLAASISSGVSDEFGKVSFSCLNSDLDAVFALFSDVVQHPRFDKDRLALAKGQTLESIRRRVDDPNTVAGIAIQQLLYDESVYGRVLVANDVKKIDREEILRAYHDFIWPDQSILTITGKASEAEVRQLVQKYFGAWKKSRKKLLPPPAVPPDPPAAIYFVEQPISQATFILGELGVPRLTPDYVAIEVFNNIFGAGGFGARLTDRVRSQLGYVYGIYGGISAGVVRGKNAIVGQTKAESTGKAIVEALKVLAKMQKEPVEASELQETKRSLKNSFVFKFDEPVEAVERRALLQILHYPPDYDDVHLALVDQVTAKEVAEVARSRWNLHHLVVVVVGNEKAYSEIQAELASGALEEFLGKIPLYRARFDQKLIVPST